jgi:hypothetical protein
MARITEEWLLKNGCTRDQIDAGDPNLARRATPSGAAVRQPAPLPGGMGLARGIFLELVGDRPPSINEVTKTGVRAGIRIKRKFFEAISVACNGLAPATGRRRVTIQIELPPGRKRLDEDNVRKYVHDGLKNAKQLVNDSPDWVEAGPIRFFQRAGRLATTIFLEDLGG